MSTSPSKYKYSFGGLNNRFRKDRKPIIDKVGYDLPSTRNTKTCTFGVGERFANTARAERRASIDQFYDIPSVFNPDKTTTTFTNHMTLHTYAFGAGRDAFKNQVIHPSNLGPDKATPGPGTYVPLHPIGTNAKKFKLKFKLDYGDPETMAKKRNVPGPGTHENVLQINKYGNYCSSEVNNSKAARFSTGARLKDYTSKYQRTPPPGAHEEFGQTAKAV